MYIVSWQVSPDTPLPLQLSGLYLGANYLDGTLPQSWSYLTSVSHCCYSVYLLFDVALFLRPCKARDNHECPLGKVLQNNLGIYLG